VHPGSGKPCGCSPGIQLCFQLSSILQDGTLTQWQHFDTEIDTLNRFADLMTVSQARFLCGFRITQWELPFLRHYRGGFPQLERVYPIELELFRDSDGTDSFSEDLADLVEQCTPNQPVQICESFPVVNMRDVYRIQQKRGCLPTGMQCLKRGDFQM
jgi:hypothetical protein